MHSSIRPYAPDDVEFLWEMLYQSLHVRDGNAPFPRSVLQQPDIAHYLSEFGTQLGDDALVACDASGAPIGAAWCRAMPADDPGYGFVAVDVPELGMAMRPAWRGQGIGRRLLVDLLERNPTMSLSVDAENVGAHALYESLGFLTIGTADGAHTMLRTGTDIETGT